VAAYLRDVRAALDDLPADERDDLLEGLEADLTELRAEEGGPLTDRLGSPQAYAAELRSAAGLPPHGGRRAPRTQRLRSAVRPLLERAAAWPGVAPVRRFLPELRPGWWVLRGYLAAWLFCVVTSGDLPGPFPRFEESLLAGLLLAAGAIALSVWIGRRTDRRPRLRRGVIVANAILGFAAVIALYDVQSQYTGSGEAYYYEQPCCVLSGTHGVISEIYPYDRDGKLLTDVQLYDQNGLPIDIADRHSTWVRPDGSTWNNVFPAYPPRSGDPNASVAPLAPSASPAPAA
jgi:hypothetical protein